MESFAYNFQLSKEAYITDYGIVVVTDPKHSIKPNNGVLAWSDSELSKQDIVNPFGFYENHPSVFDCFHTWEEMCDYYDDLKYVLRTYYIKNPNHKNNIGSVSDLTKCYTWTNSVVYNAEQVFRTLGRGLGMRVESTDLDDFVDNVKGKIIDKEIKNHTDPDTMQKMCIFTKNEMPMFCFEKDNKVYVVSKLKKVDRRAIIAKNDNLTAYLHIANAIFEFVKSRNGFESVSFNYFTATQIAKKYGKTIMLSASYDEKGKCNIFVCCDETKMQKTVVEHDGKITPALIDNAIEEVTKPKALITSVNAARLGEVYSCYSNDDSFLSTLNNLSVGKKAVIDNKEYMRLNNTDYQVTRNVDGYVYLIYVIWLKEV